MEDQFVYQDPRNKHQPRRPHNRKACMRCQSRKKKCDGKRPCEGCTKAGSECQYAKQAEDNIAFIPFESVTENQAMGFQAHAAERTNRAREASSSITWSNTFSPSSSSSSAAPVQSYNRGNSYSLSSSNHTIMQQRSDPTPNHGTPSSPGSSFRKRSWTDGGYGPNRASPHDLAKSLPPISDHRSRPPPNSLPSITTFDTMPPVEDSSSVLRRLGNMD